MMNPSVVGVHSSLGSGSFVSAIVLTPLVVGSSHCNRQVTRLQHLKQKNLRFLFESFFTRSATISKFGLSTDLDLYKKPEQRGARQRTYVRLLLTDMTTNDVRSRRKHKWDVYIKALHQFVEREGHSLVPTIHVEDLRDYGPVTLGSWVGYNRSKYRRGELRTDRCIQLSQFKGWEWGPLQAGPPSEKTRNQEIIKLRLDGASLQVLADAFDLSRQRIQQITGPLLDGEEKIK